MGEKPTNSPVICEISPDREFLSGLRRVNATDLITSDVFWYGRRVLFLTGTSGRTCHTGSRC